MAVEWASNLRINVSRGHNNVMHICFSVQGTGQDYVPLFAFGWFVFSVWLATRLIARRRWMATLEFLKRTPSSFHFHYYVCHDLLPIASQTLATATALFM